MLARKLLFIQLSLLFLSAVVTYGVASILDRTSDNFGFEHRWQRMINFEIQKDLCNRIGRDLEDFRANPTTFRRTSPQTIESETRVMLRTYLKVENIPETFPIQYRGINGKFAKCPGDLARWLEIPSTERYSRTEEDAYIRSEKVTSASTNEPIQTASNTTLKRVALVIGNSNYTNQPLKNPVNDADDMAKTLGEMGFDVIVLKDGTTEMIKNAFYQFMNKLVQGDIGFVFLSGHGLEYQGRNYFLPVNTRFKDADEIPRIAFDVSQMIERMSRSGDKLSIMVIDACRNSPVASNERGYRQGLAKMPSTTGALVGFSTSPGTIAEDGHDRNSPYTKHLIKNLRKQGLKVEEVFKRTARDVEIETAGRQVPWYSSSLRTDISLH